VVTAYRDAAYGARRHLLSVGYFSLLPERPLNLKTSEFVGIIFIINK